MTAKEIFFRESLDLTPDTCLAASGGSLTDQLNSHETKKKTLSSSLSAFSYWYCH
jgi:hypothetical protein